MDNQDFTETSASTKNIAFRDKRLAAQAGIRVISFEGVPNGKIWWSGVHRTVICSPWNDLVYDPEKVIQTVKDQVDYDRYLKLVAWRLKLLMELNIWIPAIV